MGMSTYLEEACLNTLRGQDFTGITNVYVGLFTTPGTDLTPGTEPTDAAYARQLIIFSAPTQQDGKSSMKNSNEISYNAATVDWGVISYFGLFDAATDGNYLLLGGTITAKNVEASDQIKIQPNDITVSFG